jgi:signal transduction histidine kinase
MSLALPGWLRRPSDRTKDVAVAVLVALPVVGTGISEAIDRNQPLFVLVAIAAVVALWWRRHHAVIVLAALLLIGLGMPDTVIVQLVGAIVLFRVAVTRPPPVIGTATAAYIGATALHEFLWRHEFRGGEVLGSAIISGFVVAFGLSIANRIANVTALRERAERLDRERELMAEQAVSDERVRIARELHDVVAHNVSLMVVQAQALGATVREPVVKEMTTGIADLGRQAMTEMHRTLELLRDRDTSPRRTPRPGLANLDGLVEQSRAAGVEVDLTVEGPPRPLCQSLDLSAFRIVQESLTNVRKHASGAGAHVRVAYGSDALELTVRNGPGEDRAEANGDRGGHGLTGMRERVALFGGTLDAARRADDGFEVHAVLRYDETPQP